MQFLLLTTLPVLPHNPLNAYHHLSMAKAPDALAQEIKEANKTRVFGTRGAIWGSLMTAQGAIGALFYGVAAIASGGATAVVNGVTAGIGALWAAIGVYVIKGSTRVAKDGERRMHQAAEKARANKQGQAQPALTSGSALAPATNAEVRDIEAAVVEAAPTLKGERIGDQRIRSAAISNPVPETPATTVESPAVAAKSLVTPSRSIEPYGLAG